MKKVFRDPRYAEDHVKHSWACLHLTISGKPVQFMRFSHKKGWEMVIRSGEKLVDVPISRAKIRELAEISTGAELHMV